MLTIRLQRTGKKNQADFRIVLADKESPVKKKIVEILGSYNPRKKDFRVKEDRVKYWIGQRIELSETVHNLFVTNKLVDAKKVKAFTIPKKPVEAAAAPAAPAADASPAPTPETTPPEIQPPSIPDKPAEAPVVEAVAESPKADSSAEALAKVEEKPADAIPETIES